LSAIHVRRSGRNIDRDQLRKFRLQLQQVSGLAAGRRAGVENPLAGPGCDQSCAELRGGILDRDVPVREPGQIADVHGVGQQQRLVVVLAVRDLDAARREPRSILRAGRAASIDAHPERRTLIVRVENRRGLLAPIFGERIDQPAWMRGPHRDDRDRSARSGLRARAASVAGLR
jgi:hypothetical protein